MGSHSVTCHPAAVTFPPLPQPKLVLDLATREGCKAELSSVVYVLYVVEYGELRFDSTMFDISAMIHPQGLHNLILFGSRQGRLQLWNVNTSRLLYTFTGWDSPVTALEQVSSSSSSSSSRRRKRKRSSNSSNHSRTNESREFPILIREL